MDLLNLDQRIEKNLERLESSLKEYEERIREAADIKEYFENHAIGLKDAYKKRLKQLEGELNKDKEMLSRNIQDFNDLYEKIVVLFEKLDSERKEFDILKKQFDEGIEQKWKQVEEENKVNAIRLEKLIIEKTENLEKQFNKEVAEIRRVNNKNSETLARFKKRLEHNTESISKKITKLFRN